MAARVHLDFETRSRENIRAAGLSRYVRHLSTEPLMLEAQVFFNDDPEPDLYSIDFTDVVSDYIRELPKLDRELFRVMADKHTVNWAWNAPFEIGVLEFCMGFTVPLSQWRDTMALALACSLPGRLDHACKAIGLPEDTAKSNEGRRLIRKFSVPRKPTKKKPYEWCTRATDPEDWALFREYCRQDVVAEHAIYKRLVRFDLPPHEWALWALDQKINRNGWPVDRDLAEAAVRMSDIAKKKALQKLVGLTGLDNPNSVAQLLPWLKANGYPHDSLAKEYVADAVNKELAE